MTVEEALTIIEISLDYKQLSEVQKLVFQKSWEGQSYKSIAKNSTYDEEYLRIVGGKLWQLLSEVLEERVTKNNLIEVLKRYRRRTQTAINKNRVVEVNLNGATLNGEGISIGNISGAKLLFTNLSDVNLCQVELLTETKPDDKTELREEITNQENQYDAEEQSYDWNGWHFRSEEEVEIAEALDRAGVLFIPKSRIRMTTSEGKQNQQPDFLIFYQGKWGVLQVWHEDEEKDRESAIAELQIFQSHGIQTVQHYYASRCQIEPDRVVQEFLEILISAD
jgi:hypothetical protein